jgi:hypothetical protein
MWVKEKLFFILTKIIVITALLEGCGRVKKCSYLNSLQMLVANIT